MGHYEIHVQQLEEVLIKFNINTSNIGCKKKKKNGCYVFFLNYTQISIWRGGEKPPGSYKSGETIGFGWHLQVVSKNSHHRFVKKKKKTNLSLWADDFKELCVATFIVLGVEFYGIGVLLFLIYLTLSCVFFKHEIFNGNSFSEL